MQFYIIWSNFSSAAPFRRPVFFVYAAQFLRRSSVVIWLVIAVQTGLNIF